MKALLKKTKIYFKPEERGLYIAVLLLWDRLTEWIKTSKVLTNEEKDKLNKASNTIEEVSDEILSKTDKNFGEKIANEIDHSTIYIENNVNTKLTGNFGYRNVLMDDVYDLADYAMDKCINCKCEDFHNCPKYKLFVSLTIPVASNEAPDCPYKN